jgi:Acetyltransferase (GNAT) domain
MISHRLADLRKSNETLRVEVVKDLEGLRAYATSLEDLSAAAIERNPFFEDWMLIPAFKFLKEGSDLSFVLIHTPGNSEFDQGRLCGFFPVVRNDRWKGFPIRVYSMWRYAYCSLCTPLIRQGYGYPVIEALFKWLAAAREGCILVEFNEVTAEGPFNRLLFDFIKDRSLSGFVYNRFGRALYRPERDVDAHMQRAVSSKYRSQLRRKQKRLSELGPIRFAELQSHLDASEWIDEFLRLEATGWKGQEESAMLCKEAWRSFFVEAARGAFARDRLSMLEMRLGDELLAQRCSFTSGRESFLFKLAYNEEFSRFSPGILLEIENLGYLNRRDLSEDSCTAPDNPVFNHLWVERKLFQTTVVSWSRPGAMAISAMELFRKVKRRLPIGRNLGKDD